MFSFLILVLALVLILVLILVLFQEWEDAESLQAHYATPHMDAFLRRLPDILDGEIITRRYAVQSVEEEQAVVVAAEKPTIH